MRATLSVLMVLAILGACIGYFMNLVSAVSMFVHDAPFTGMFAGRIVGIFVPFVGAILGWF